jgi:hypothetical protein
VRALIQIVALHPVRVRDDEGGPGFNRPVESYANPTSIGHESGARLEASISMKIRVSVIVAIHVLFLKSSVSEDGIAVDFDQLLRPSAS